MLPQPQAVKGAASEAAGKIFSRAQIEPSDFRRTLGYFCTGVVTITGYDRGEPIGFTAQSLVSLSLDPPLVGFSPSKSSETWPRLRNSKLFCVNILCEDQVEICEVFARRSSDRFKKIGWRHCASGLPVIDGSLGYICCTLEAEYETGDHFFVVGHVGELNVLRPENEPLLFFRGVVRSGSSASS